MTQSALAWSYFVLIAGASILIIGVILSLYGGRSSKKRRFGARARSLANDPELKRRMETLERRMAAGEISRNEYNRRRTEILVEQYKREAA